jgi:hypothetical protein
VEDTVATGIEIPEYEVVDKVGDLEVRRYAPLMVAAVTVEGDRNTASNRGFRLLADYIFGNNQPAAKIAMTAPVDVTQEAESGSGAKIAMTAPVDVSPDSGDADRWRVTFTMPSEYDRGSLPTPNDPRVRIEEVGSRCVAAVRFSGFTSNSRVEEKTAELEAWMTANGYEKTGAPILSRYDPPWKLPFFRRNEVQIQTVVADAC